MGGGLQRHQQVRTCTVLYCNILYCTALYCVQRAPDATAACNDIAQSCERVARCCASRLALQGPKRLLHALVDEGLRACRSRVWCTSMRMHFSAPAPRRPTLICTPRPDVASHVRTCRTYGERVRQTLFWWGGALAHLRWKDAEEDPCCAEEPAAQVSVIVPLGDHADVDDGPAGGKKDH